jgi:hypothetical protein
MRARHRLTCIPGKVSHNATGAIKGSEHEGVVVLIWLRSRRPEAVHAVAHVYLEDEGM